MHWLVTSGMTDEDSHLQHEMDGASVGSDGHRTALWDGAFAPADWVDGLRVGESLDL